MNDKNESIKELTNGKEANTDLTYCYGMNCKEKCWRYAGNYKFNKGYQYSFVAGIVGDFKCIEREIENE